MASPNGQRRPVETDRTYVITKFAKLQGGGAAANLVNLDATINGGGEITSATRTGAGTYTIVFPRVYQQLLMAPLFSFVDAGGVSGLDGTVTAMDVTAGTATFVFANNATPADVATTTTVYVTWTVRASSKN